MRINADDGNTAVDQPFILQMGATSEYAAGVNEADVLAAYRSYATIFARKQGLDATVDAEIYENAGAIRIAIKKERLHAVGLLTPEYFQAIADDTLDLMFTVITDGTVGEEYLLIGHQDQSSSLIENPSGRHLLVLGGNEMGMARIWLDTYFMERGLPPGEFLFGSIEVRTRLSQAVLPVYFGQADLCLVTKNGFDTMVELNPQVGRSLSAIAHSPILISEVTCFRRTFTGSYRNDTVSAYLEAHLYPEGQQTLTLFQIEAAVPVTPDDLALTQKLYQRYLELSSGLPGHAGLETHSTLHPANADSEVPWDQQ